MRRKLTWFDSEDLAGRCSPGGCNSIPRWSGADGRHSSRMHRNMQAVPYFHLGTVRTVPGRTGTPQLCHSYIVPWTDWNFQVATGQEAKVRAVMVDTCWLLLFLLLFYQFIDVVFGSHCMCVTRNSNSQAERHWTMQFFTLLPYCSAIRVFYLNVNMIADLEKSIQMLQGWWKRKSVCK